jgi:outer membrane protein OmpA-like peptidoglycan-associated protein
MNSAIGILFLIPLMLVLLDQILVARRSAPQKPPAPVIEPMDQPPIITISEAQVYSFPSGEATISAPFRQLLLHSVAPQLEELGTRYRCDIIEVIGHTDEQRVQERSNLDIALLPHFHGRPSMLRPGSNADLGLMRAWAVIEVLKDDFRLRNKTFHGYSAGQSLLPNGQLATPQFPPADNPARRRIEIRLRRSEHR